MRWLILALLIIPAMEIGLFVWVGGMIGPWWVVLLIILTGIVGIAIAKREGIGVWNRAQQSMSHGQAPTNELVDGICIFAGAVFLLTPGFITDTFGFILVLPWTRSPFKKWLQKLFKYMKNKNTIIYRK